MQSRPPLRNQQTEERPKGQPRKLPRFRLIRLEDRIAPAKPAPTKQCVLTVTCYANRCRW